MIPVAQIGYKYKLRLNWRTKDRLNQWIGANRLLWNLALSQREMIEHKEFKFRETIAGNFSSLNYNYQEKQLKALKNEYPFFKDLPSQSLQQCLMQLDRAVKSFFKKRADFPKPKKKGKREAGIRFPSLKEGAIEYDKHSRRKAWVTLPKIGRLRFVSSRPFSGKVKNVTLTKQGMDFFVSFGIDQDLKVVGNTSGSAVGIDRGVVHTLAISNGEFLDLPTERIKLLEDKIAKLQARLAKKKKFSANWMKQNKKINRVHHRITNIRKDFLWKSAHNLTKNHGMIGIEDLGTQRMTKSAKGSIENPGRKVAQKSGLNRAILRQGWYDFSVKLKWQAEKHDARVIEVAPHNTSIICSACSHKSSANRISQELFRCVECRYEDNADTNAAKKKYSRTGGWCNRP